MRVPVQSRFFATSSLQLNTVGGSSRVRPKEAKGDDSSTLHSRANSRAAKTCVESSPSHGRKRRERRDGEELKNSQRDTKKV